MSFDFFTNIGNNRENNEDNYLILQPKKIQAILAVADGMGGHNAGEVASKVAIDTIKEFSFNFEKDIITQIESVVTKANENIFNYSEQKDDYKDMGTTLTLCLIKDNSLYFGHVGDSRLYIYSDKLNQITTDHSLVNDLVENKTIKPDEAFDHPNKNIITQALGVDRDLEIQTGQTGIESDDIIMLCTDGLTDMVRFESIEKVFQQNEKVDTILDTLGNKALHNGGNDNITIIMGKL
ncbi:MAG: Stp1/IreP family PP2C-type Ser/Thr phosphatase [Halanaerobiales bacterium]|nr:Stp1/IreP family PP2C-type Ser/Thr phosphatase [Halanaerobiales bacterium]